MLLLLLFFFAALFTANLALLLFKNSLEVALEVHFIRLYCLYEWIIGCKLERKENEKAKKKKNKTILSYSIIFLRSSVCQSISQSISLLVNPFTRFYVRLLVGWLVS